jgi:hypothetical protein
MPATNSDANSKSMHKKAHKWPYVFFVQHDLRQKLTFAHRIQVTMDRAARCTRLQIHTTKAIIDYATTATARILHKTAFDARAHLKASIELQYTASSIPSNKSPAFAFCFFWFWPWNPCWLWSERPWQGHNEREPATKKWQLLKLIHGY